MSTVAYAMTDSATMLRRRLRHMRRYPSLTLMLAGLPIVLLLLFVYVFAARSAPDSATSPAAAPTTSTTSRPGSS
jgi:hypothetical protein